MITSSGRCDAASRERTLTLGPLSVRLCSANETSSWRRRCESRTKRFTSTSYHPYYVEPTVTVPSSNRGDCRVAHVSPDSDQLEPTPNTDVATRPAPLRAP